MKKYWLVAMISALLFGSLAVEVHGQESTGVGSYASVNGLEMYYEVYGEGEPLLLLHGGLGGIVEFSSLIPTLAEARQVIAVELQGHGHTADVDRPLSFEGMADDIAAFVEVLGYEAVDVMGYSLGGMVAIQTAIRHPEVVDKLVLVSAPYRWDAIHAEFRGGMEAMNADSAPMMLETPMYAYYSSVALDVDQWSTLIDKLGDMFREGFDWSANISSISAPTLIVVGDSDMLPPTHAAEFFSTLGGGVAGGFAPPPTGQLAVLPNTNHFEILWRPELATLVPTFLDQATTPPA
jgi:pimeloyl-ACP methyl ester carboxylesterase